MFRVSLSALVYVYLFLLLAGLLAIWIVEEIRRLRRERARLRHRLQCAMCSLEWDDASAETLPRCPRCGSLNER